jgi:hypothetical protein
MFPFVVSDSLWRSGVGGSIPSLIAYCLGAVGIFRLVRTGLLQTTIPPATARVGAWLAALLYLANPNLIYLQTTAMTEPLYLALFIWAVVFLNDFVLRLTNGQRGAGRALVACALCLCGAELTRYDGWFTTGIFGLVVLGFLLRDRKRLTGRVTASFIAFVLICAAGPLLWLKQNHDLHHQYLYFANGPYSARAIEQRASPGPSPHHPGDHSLRISGRYYLVDATLNLGEYPYRRILFWAAVAGVVLGAMMWKGSLLWLLLWIPLPFYMLSIAYGAVPIFMPVDTPYSYYNVRYGLELLPAICVFAALFFGFISECVPSRIAAVALLVAGFAVGAATYTSAYVVPGFRWSYLPGEPRRGPVSWREGVVNAITREQYEHKLAAVLEQLPPTSTLLMYTGDHVGALQDAGIHFDRVINESNYGWWDVALRAPAVAANYVVAAEGDPVWNAVQQNPAHLEPLATVVSPGQPRTIVYRAPHDYGVGEHRH